MTKRTRLFLFGAAGILVIGLGTGLVASYVGVENLAIIGSNGPDELAYVPADTRGLAFANVREVMDSELRQKLMQMTGHTPGTDGERFRNETGIDIERDVDQVVAAMPS